MDYFLQSASGYPVCRILQQEQNNKVFLKHIFSIIAEAIIPEEQVLIKTPNGTIEQRRNTYTSHFSFSYNKRWNFVFRWTWDGYKFFSTVALILYMIRGTPDQVLLGIVCFALEGFPQFLICVMNVTHWDGPYERTAVDFFCTIVDVPMSLWYLTFYE